MTAPVSRLDDAVAAARTVSRSHAPGERTDVHLERHAQRRLTITSSRASRVQARDGRFAGHLRIERAGRELDVPVLDASSGGLVRAAAVGRRAQALGRRTPPPRPAHHDAIAPDGAADVRSGDEPFEVDAVAADPAPCWDAVGAGLGSQARLRGLAVTAVLHESVFAGWDADPRGGVTRGVEIAASAARAPGAPVVTVSRYASRADRLDLDGLGRELALVAAQGVDGPAVPRGTVVLTPTCAARLVDAVVGGLLADPVRSVGRVRVPLVDDGRAVDGYLSSPTDCEGTPTGRLEIVDRGGAVQQPTSRASASGPSLTGHARWDHVWKQPRLRTANPFLDGTDEAERLLAGERCVVVDLRPLGIAANQAGAGIAFRVQAVRAVDGTPTSSCSPCTVSGSVAGFLAAVVRACPPVSFFPGEFGSGGGYLELDLTGLEPRSVS